MGKPCDAAKERYWRKVLRRQAGSGLTAGRFCEREHVPMHQFYWWRRTLRARDRQGVGREPSSGIRRPACKRRHAARSPFLPLPLPVSLGAPIEVVHPRGHVVRIPALFDAHVLGRVLATLDLPTAAEA